MSDSFSLSFACPACRREPDSVEPGVLEFSQGEMYIGIDEGIVPIYQAFCPQCCERSPWAVDHLSAYFAMVDKLQGAREGQEGGDTEDAQP